jgi:hypothetical protein
MLMLMLIANGVIVIAGVCTLATVSIGLFVFAKNAAQFR